MRLSDYSEFVNELEMTALGKQAAAILRNLENDRDEAVKQLAESRGRFGDMEARVVELEAVIRAALDVNSRWPGDDVKEIRGILSSAPSVVLADHDAAVWEQGRMAWAKYEMACEDASAAGQGHSVTKPKNPYRGDINA